jgi:hypothetical protein
MVQGHVSSSTLPSFLICLDILQGFLQDKVLDPDLWNEQDYGRQEISQGK